MRTNPAQLILVASVTTLFGFAGVASRTCSFEHAGAELLPESASFAVRGADTTSETSLDGRSSFHALPLDAPVSDTPSLDALSFEPAHPWTVASSGVASLGIIPSSEGPAEVLRRSASMQP